MGPFLKAINGQYKGAKFPIEGHYTRIGRHHDCEVHLDLDSVSRIHAQVVQEDGITYIEDLRSKNKTFVNGEAIGAKTLLADNDRIRIAEVLFVFHASEPPTGNLEPPSATAMREDAGSRVLAVVDASGVESVPSVRPEVKLQAVLDISQAVCQTLDLDKVFHRVLERLLKIFPQMDRGLVVLVDDSGKLTPHAVNHRSGAGGAIRFSETVVRRAIADRKAILSTDASDDASFGMADSVAELDLRSIMCVPLAVNDGQPLGVIQVDTHNQMQPFTHDDLHLLVIVAGQAAIAVENAKLHADIVQREQMLYAGHVEQEWIKSELELAREVQSSFLPRGVPKIEGYEFWTHYEAAVQVGGDFYDCLPLPNGKWAILIADVSGKAISAALFMAKALSDTRVALLTHLDQPEVAMTQINRSILASGLVGRFISMALCILDPTEHRMKLVNAGHFSPILRRPDGRMEEIADSNHAGLLLGVSTTAQYDAIERALMPGECIVFYTDGITEALDGERGTQYGAERLMTCIAAVGPDPKQLGEAIVRDVRDHTAGYKQSDDMTLVLFRRLPSS